MPKKKLLIRYRPRGAGVRTTGGGVRTTGGGLKRTGCGKTRGGSMRHLAIPPAVRDAHINKLTRIVKDAAKPGTSKTSTMQRIKNWALGAHKVAQTYGLYSKGANVARIGYNLYNARKGRRPLSVGYSSVQSVD